MSGLERFLKEGRQERKNVFYPAASDIREEDGSTALWELRYLTTAQCESVKKDCMRQSCDKDGIIRERLDTGLYMDRLLTESVVFPNLLNAELQDSYGVYTPEELLKALISNPSEYAAFADYVYGMLGFKPMRERVEQAKN